MTGASGAGKTTLIKKLRNNTQAKNFAFLNFDSIHVPSPKEMMEEFGSPEEWQRQKLMNGWNELRLIT